MAESSHAPLPAPPPHLVHLLVDSHAHPADDPLTFTSSLSSSAEATADSLRSKLLTCQLGTVVAMSTSYRDLSIVRHLSPPPQQAPEILPCFGLHPWFTHAISLQDTPLQKRRHYLDLFAGHKGAEEEVDAILDDLPQPTPLKDLLERVREGLESNPAAMLGEVGLDRAFRIPRKRWSYDPANANASRNGPQDRAQSCSSDATPSSNADGNDDRMERKENKKEPAKPPRTKSNLTRLKTPLAHQLTILHAQLSLAVRLGRNVSLHSVQSSGATLDLIRDLHLLHPGGFQLGARDINLSFHSCTMDVNVIRSLLRTYPNVYIGFSTTINKKKQNCIEMIREVERNRLLVESDVCKVEEMAESVWEAVRLVAQVCNGWTDQDVVALENAGQEGKNELHVVWKRTAEQLNANWKRFCRNAAVNKRDGGEARSENSDEDDD